MIFSPTRQCSLCLLRWTPRMARGRSMQHGKRCLNNRIYSVLSRWRGALGVGYNWGEGLEKIRPDSLLEVQRTEQEAKDTNRNKGKPNYIKSIFFHHKHSQPLEPSLRILESPFRDRKLHETQLWVTWCNWTCSKWGIHIFLPIGIILWFYKP